VEYRELAKEIGLMPDDTTARRPPRKLYDLLLKVGERNYREIGPINGLVIRKDTKISGRGFFIWYADKGFSNKRVDEMMTKDFYEREVKKVCYNRAESGQS